MPRRNVPINYFSRDFASIKNDLVQHAKRYYPDTFQDFNEAGFGSLILDTVAYVGDNLSFYLDYSVNEGFLDTASEIDNILKLAKPFGFQLKENPSSHGIAVFFILVPANDSGLGPDSRYIPILKKGSAFSTQGGNEFLLEEDVFFDGIDNEVVVAQVNDNTGLPTSYAIKSYGRIVSGKFEESLIAIGDFTKFLKVEVPIANVAEVLLIEDSEGHEYFEVDYLSQDVIYRPILNRTSTKNQAPSILRPFTVPRRFVVIREEGKIFLQFGHGSDSATVTSEKVVDPANVILNILGKDHITDESFDPNNLVRTDKFGIVPENTTLRVVVRANTADNVNAGVGAIRTVSSAIFEFEDSINLNTNLMRSVRNSIEVSNEAPILGDVSFPNSDELKKRIFSSFGAQNRAVTKQDYQSLIYSMPAKFGSIKRANVIRDADSFKRNLNIYVVSEDETGFFTETNVVIKQNLKVWLAKNKMINDTIDILDGKVINLGIIFSALGDLERDKFDILSDATVLIQNKFSIKSDFGQPFFITDIYDALKETPGVLDVLKVKVIQKNGGFYSDIRFNIDENISPDGRYIAIPENVVWEIRFPDTDIRGMIS
jgi:hypothetical protein